MEEEKAWAKGEAEGGKTGMDKDITEKNRSKERIEHLNSLLHAIRKVNQLITKERNPGRLLQMACDILVSSRGYYNTWIITLDDSGDIVHSFESGLGEKFQALLERAKCYGLTNCGRRAVSQGDVILIKDPPSECIDCPLSGKYSGRGAMTIRLDYSGKVYGLLCVSIPIEYTRNDDEIDLFKELANDLAFALHDIEIEHKHKQAEESLQEHRELLYQAQKMETLGALIAGLAHEINNPINFISINVNLVKRVWSDLQSILNELKQKDPTIKFGGLDIGFLQENMGQLLVDIGMGAKRVEGIVQDLKGYAKKSAMLEKSQISINTAVENALSLCRMTIEKSKFSLKVNLTEDIPLMEGVLQKIEQIVINLVTNAIEASDYGQGSIGITTGSTQERRYLFIRISDNGRGIDPAISEKIYDPFVTTKKRDQSLGIGLYITKNLVEEHGGEILFQSRKEQGATFSVLLPSIEQ